MATIRNVVMACQLDADEVFIFEKFVHDYRSWLSDSWSPIWRRTQDKVHARPSSTAYQHFLFYRDKRRTTKSWHCC